jgi:hypothetical protein
LELLAEVVPCVLALGEDVVAEEGERLEIGVLELPVAALDSVSAEHDEVRAEVVLGVLVDVVKRELGAGVTAERTLVPLAVESFQELGVANASSWPRVRLPWH